MLVTKLNLDLGETILLEVRRHWFVFWLEAFLLFLAALAPLVLWTIVNTFLLSTSKIIVFLNLHLAEIVFLYSLWILLCWIVFFIKWTNYYLDVWYITEKRIIDIEQKSLFHREVSNLRFDKIQDISIEVNGIIPTFLNYGDIRVQTAAENSKSFQMTNVSRPEDVRSLIFSRHNREGDRKNHVVHEMRINSKIDPKIDSKHEQK